ncbi:MAG: hypothetical protein ACI9QD_000422 [Thermoproteota archaeon]|jgi:hypothetical protein
MLKKRYIFLSLAMMSQFVFAQNIFVQNPMIDNEYETVRSESKLLIARQLITTEFIEGDKGADLTGFEIGYLHKYLVNSNISAAFKFSLLVSAKAKTDVTVRITDDQSLQSVSAEIESTYSVAEFAYQIYFNKYSTKKWKTFASVFYSDGSFNRKLPVGGQTLVIEDKKVESYGLSIGTNFKFSKNLDMLIEYVAFGKIVIGDRDSQEISRLTVGGLYTF